LSIKDGDFKGSEKSGPCKRYLAVFTVSESRLILTSTLIEFWSLESRGLLASDLLTIVRYVSKKGLFEGVLNTPELKKASICALKLDEMNAVKSSINKSFRVFSKFANSNTINLEKKSENTLVKLKKIVLLPTLEKWQSGRLRQS